jgi:hypothetical protein
MGALLAIGATKVGSATERISWAFCRLVAYGILPIMTRWHGMS